MLFLTRVLRELKSRGFLERTTAFISLFLGLEDVLSRCHIVNGCLTLQEAEQSGSLVDLVAALLT